MRTRSLLLVSLFLFGCTSGGAAPGGPDGSTPGDGNAAPTAQGQHRAMLADEPSSITLIASDPDGDRLDFVIVTEPAHGTVIVEGASAIYQPDVGFEGADSFLFAASDGVARDVAEVRIDVVGGPCLSSNFGAPTEGLYVHVPNHVASLDLSEARRPVWIRDLGSEATDAPWRSRLDLHERSVKVDLGAAPPAVAGSSLSFAFIPERLEGDQTILDTDAVAVELRGAALWVVIGPDTDSKTEVAFDVGALHTRSCNRLAVVVDGGELRATLNGATVTAPLAGAAPATHGDALVAGPYAGRAWDLRLYDRALSEAEVVTLEENCSPGSAAAEREPGYPNYLCGVYVCEYWPDGTDLSLDTYQYYVAAQDEAYERFVFEAMMYPRENLCDYMEVDSGRHLVLSEGIRNTFVRPFGFDDPLTVANGHHWLHENFHSFQGRLARYNGFGGNKYFLESTASWGSHHARPGNVDDLLGYYTFHPHLPLWTIQDSPVDDRAGSEFKGGHQYGASIFWSYLTWHVLGPRLVGDIFNDPGCGSEPLRVAAELLAAEGIDLREVFPEFAARLTTWDMDHGELLAEAEAVSLRRMQSQQAGAQIFDAKIAGRYGHEGAGDAWTPVDPLFVPGGWAFVAYEVSVDEASRYRAAVRVPSDSPAGAEFRPMVVIRGADDARRYLELGVAHAGEEVGQTFAAQAGDRVYLIVATTPEAYRDQGDTWVFYPYDFRLHPEAP